MVNIPVRFRRVAAAFDEAVRLCESSGSEHSAASDDNLSDLVASFMEKESIHIDDEELFNIDEEIKDQQGEGDEEDDRDDGLFGSEVLKDLVTEDYEEEKEMVRREVEIVRNSIDDGRRSLSMEDFKRRIMSGLREKGFDAGLCKSRWERSGHRPSGTYQYIDIHLNDTRYIIELNLASQFEHARSTPQFCSLLDFFPTVFVVRPAELKNIVRVMCRAMKQTMKTTVMAMPPWRRNSYMQCKWFGSYKRTTNKLVPARNGIVGGSFRRSVGFVASPVVGGYCRCREKVLRDAPMRMGQLTASFLDK